MKRLNKLIEQEHRFIKKKVRASQCFKSFHTAERTLEGIEAMHRMRKDQVKRLSGDDAQGKSKFAANLFGVAAYGGTNHGLVVIKNIFRHPTEIAAGGCASKVDVGRMSRGAHQELS